MTFRKLPAAVLLSLVQCLPQAVIAPAHRMPSATEHPCVASLAAAPTRLPNERRQFDVIMGKPIGSKRLIFPGKHRWSLAIDYAIFASTIRELEMKGEYFRPEEQMFFELLAQAAATQDDIRVQPEMRGREKQDYFIGQQLEGRTFKLIENDTGETFAKLLVLQYTYNCGPTCGGGGAEYYYPDCTTALTTLDWVN